MIMVMNVIVMKNDDTRGDGETDLCHLAESSALSSEDLLLLEVALFECVDGVGHMGKEKKEKI